MSSRVVLRLLWAALMSVFSFTATLWWYHNQKVPVVKNTDAPIATVISSDNEVQRRPKDRLLWQPIERGEAVYQGEALRTAEDSYANVVFVQNGPTIKLDPQSMIVLEEEPTGVTIDFLKGGMFIQAPQDNQKAVKITSGKDVIEAKTATVSLERNIQGEVSVQTLEGSVEVKRNGKQTKVEKNQKVRIKPQTIENAARDVRLTFPRSGDIFYAPKGQLLKLSLRVNNTPDGDHLAIKRAARRSALATAPEFPLSFTSSEASLNLPPGRHVLQLVSKVSEAPVDNGIVLVDVREIIRPIPIEPRAEQSLEWDRKNPEFSFRWLDSMNLESPVIQVATDARFVNRIAQSYAPAGQSFLKQKIEKPGDYYWRVTGFLRTQGKTLPIVSDAIHFRVQATEVKPEVQPEPQPAQQPVQQTQQAKAVPPTTLPPKEVPAVQTVPNAAEPVTPTEKPVETVEKPAEVPKRAPAAKPSPRWPSDEQAKLTASADGNVDLSWEPMENSKSYHIEVRDFENKTVMRQKVAGNSTSLKNLKPGQYTVRVRSVFENGQASAFSPARSLEVPGTSNIAAPKLESIEVQ